MRHLHSRQLPLQLHLFIQARLRFEDTSTGFLRRCSIPFVFSTPSGIARYAIMSDTRHEDQTASSKKPPPSQNPYPYPTHAKPTPHEIFHLSPGATQNEIKERYYDLVRTHHPDSFHARLCIHDPAQAHSRFRSIKAAYDFLRGRTLSPDPNVTPPPSPQNFDPYLHEMARRRRAYNASRDEGAEGFGAPKQERGEWNENGKKERLILLCGVVALLGGLFPSFPMTVVSIIFPASILPTSIFPFSLFLSSSQIPFSPSPKSSSDQPDLPPSAPSLSSVFPFALDFSKTHREAATALSEARQEARDMGVERREEVRKRVKEMTKDTGAGEGDNTPREQ